MTSNPTKLVPDIISEKTICQPKSAAIGCIAAAAFRLPESDAIELSVLGLPLLRLQSFFLNRIPSRFSNELLLFAHH